MGEENLNLINRFKNICKKYPHKKAIFYKGKYITYLDLYQKCVKYDYILKSRKIIKKKTTILIPFSFDFVSIFIALWQKGNTVYFFEPWIKINEIFSHLLKEIEVLITDRYMLSFFKILGKEILNPFKTNVSKTDDKIEDLKNDDILIVSFTTGLTKSKKIKRNLKNLYYQYLFIDRYLNFKKDKVLTFFPMMLFFHILKGNTTYIYPYKNIKNIDVLNLVEFVKRNKIDRIYLAPFLLKKVLKILKETNTHLKNIEFVCGGGPLDHEFIKKYENFISFNKIFLVYGTQEAEPIAIARLDEILDLKGKGYIAGKPLEEIKIDILDTGIKVKGENVSNGEVFIEDKCYIDDKGYLWILGRYGIENYVYEKEILKFKGIKDVAIFYKNKEIKIKVIGDRRSKSFVKKLLEKSFEKIDIKFVKKIPYDRRHHSKKDYFRIFKKFARKIPSPINAEITASEERIPK